MPISGVSELEYTELCRLPFDEYAVDELRTDPRVIWCNQFLVELFRRGDTGELSTLSYILFQFRPKIYSIHLSNVLQNLLT